MLDNAPKEPGSQDRLIAVIRLFRSDGFGYVLGRGGEFGMVVQEANARVPAQQHVVVAVQAERLGCFE